MDISLGLGVTCQLLTLSHQLTENAKPRIVEAIKRRGSIFMGQELSMRTLELKSQPDAGTLQLIFKQMQPAFGGTAQFPSLWCAPSTSVSWPPFLIFLLSLAKT